MINGNFYFLSDEYFVCFEEENLMKNKEVIEGAEHNRPCYYAFKDEEDERILWMIPVSSRMEKYEKQYNRSIEKYGLCDAISLGYLKGNKTAFLLQNMCPVTEKYILNEYVDAQNHNAIKISNGLKKELNAKARKIIRLANQGKKLTFTNVIRIRQRLLEEMECLR